MKKNTILTTAKILIFSFLAMLAGELAWELLVPEISEANAFLYTFMQYVNFLSSWVVFGLLIFAIKKNKYIKDAIIMNTEGNTLYYLMLGLVIGFILNLSCVIVAGLNGDISLSFVGFRFFPVLWLFIAVFIQSSAEELICRGYIYQKLLKLNPKPIYAILVNSLFFAILHLSNDGMGILAFYDMIITAIFFSMVTFYFDSIWMAMGLHTTWNFSQSIVFGLPNSGASFPYSIFRLDGITRNSFAYNTEFGLEGTILSSILMTICCLGLYLWKNKDKNMLKEATEVII